MTFSSGYYFFDVLGKFINVVFGLGRRSAFTRKFNGETIMNDMILQTLMFCEDNV